MPQRFLRPGLTSSRSFNSVDFFSQTLFVRLITLVDDYGRYDAHTKLLCSHAFPLSEITCEQMLSACEQLQQAGLVFFFRKNGKEYLQLSKWIEKPRSASKYEAFTDDCEQMFANDNKCSSPSSSSSPQPSSSPSPFARKWPEAADVVQHGKALVPVASEDFCRWWWESMDSVGWVDDKARKINNWKTSLAAAWRGRIHNDQEKAHREKERTKLNGTSANRPAESSRNIGTANEGRGHLYNLKDIEARRNLGAQDAGGTAA